MNPTPRAQDPAQYATAEVVSLGTPIVPRARSFAEIATAERTRLAGELDDICSGARALGPRATVDTALEALAELQVVGANADACDPPRFAVLARAITGFADARLRGQPDAIERGLTFANDATLRKLIEE